MRYAPDHQERGCAPRNSIYAQPDARRIFSQGDRPGLALGAQQLELEAYVVQGQPRLETEQLRLRLPVAAIRRNDLLMPFLSQLFRHGINIEAEQLSVCLDYLRDESHWQIIRIASFHFADDSLFALRRYHAVL